MVKEAYEPISRKVWKLAKKCPDALPFVSVEVIGPLRQGDTAAVVDHFGVGIAHVEGMA